MTNRVTYDRVEAKAVKIARLGHDIKLYLRYDGMLQVFYHGELVLSDGPRDYSVALAKVQSYLDVAPQLPANDNVTERNVRRGKKTRTPAAVKKKASAKKKGSASAKRK